MGSAVVTYCGHFFHGNCLRKWLYVQETCPMCHQAIRPTLPGQGGAPSADADLPVQDEHPHEDDEASQEADDTPAAPDPTQPPEEAEVCCGSSPHPAEPQGGGHHRFSPAADCVWSSAPRSSGPTTPPSVGGESGSCAGAPERAQGGIRSHDSSNASLRNSQADVQSWGGRSDSDATQPDSD